MGGKDIYGESGLTRPLRSCFGLRPQRPAISEYFIVQNVPVIIVLLLKIEAKTYQMKYVKNNKPGGRKFTKES